MSGEARRRHQAVHVHVHNGAAPGAVDLVQQELASFREQLEALGDQLTLLGCRDQVLSDRIDVVAHRLYAALDGDHRRKLRRGQPSIAQRLAAPPQTGSVS